MSLLLGVVMPSVAVGQRVGQMTYCNPMDINYRYNFEQEKSESREDGKSERRAVYYYSIDARTAKIVSAVFASAFYSE